MLRGTLWKFGGGSERVGFASLSVVQNFTNKESERFLNRNLHWSHILVSRIFSAPVPLRATGKILKRCWWWYQLDLRCGSGNNNRHFLKDSIFVAAMNLLLRCIIAKFVKGLLSIPVRHKAWFISFTRQRKTLNSKNETNQTVSRSGLVSFLLLNLAFGRHRPY